MVNPGLLGLRLHDVPGHPGTLGVGVLAIHPTDHQRPQLILFAGALRARIHGQHPRLLVHLPPLRGHPPAAHPMQPRGEAALHFQFLVGTPGFNAVRIVIQQLPLQVDAGPHSGVVVF